MKVILLINGGMLFANNSPITKNIIKNKKHDDKNAKEIIMALRGNVFNPRDFMEPSFKFLF
jgi:hypothetical protein